MTLAGYWSLEEMGEKFSFGSSNSTSKGGREKLSEKEKLQSRLPGFWQMPKENQ